MAFHLATFPLSTPPVARVTTDAGSFVPGKIERGRNHPCKPSKVGPGAARGAVVLAFPKPRRGVRGSACFEEPDFPEHMGPMVIDRVGRSPSSYPAGLRA